MTNDGICENCGGTFSYKEHDLKICEYCGSTIKNEDNIEIIQDDFSEELRKEEIKRLIKNKQKMFVLPQQKEPIPGLLTDDEILKYAPKSNAALSIRCKRYGFVKGFLKSFW
jgi:hypothetical protein